MSTLPNETFKYFDATNLSLVPIRRNHPTFKESFKTQEACIKILFSSSFSHVNIFETIIHFKQTREIGPAEQVVIINCWSCRCFQKQFRALKDSAGNPQTFSSFLLTSFLLTEILHDFERCIELKSSKFSGVLLRGS